MTFAACILSLILCIFFEASLFRVFAEQNDLRKRLFVATWIVGVAFGAISFALSAAVFFVGHTELLTKINYISGPLLAFSIIGFSFVWFYNHTRWIYPVLVLYFVLLTFASLKVGISDFDPIEGSVGIGQMFKDKTVRSWMSTINTFAFVFYFIGLYKFVKDNDIDTSFQDSRFTGVLYLIVGVLLPSLNGVLIKYTWDYLLGSVEFLGYLFLYIGFDKLFEQRFSYD